MMSRAKKKPHSSSARIAHSKRLLLQAMELTTWSKQLQGTLKFLANLQNLRSTEEKGWVAGNTKYYLQRALALCDNAPKGTEALVRDARKFLATIQ